MFNQYNILESYWFFLCEYPCIFHVFLEEFLILFFQVVKSIEALSILILKSHRAADL